jgi:thioredoxin 1
VPWRGTLEGMNPVSPDASASPVLLVACLCAQWCGTCREYRALFDGLQADFSGQARFVWVDIEDEADLVGALEVEDFPTLLIAQGGEVRFFGPLLPLRQTLHQTVQRALAGRLMRVDEAALADLALQLAQH